MAAAYPQWEYDILTGIGAPASPANLEALYGWANSEGTASENNPLAVSGKHAGATKCLAQCDSASPIYAYDTEADGVAANVSFLKYPNYVSIVSAFANNKGLKAIYQAINSSKWCSGCQGGQYPAGLLTLVNGSTPGAAGAATATTGPSSLIPGGGSSAPSTPCAWGISFGSLGKVCFLSSSQVKAFTAAIAIAGGVIIGGFGVVMVAAAVGKSSGATAAVKSAPLPKVKTSRPTSQPRAVNKALKSPDDDAEKLAYQRGMFAGQGGSARPRDYARTTGNPRPKTRRTNGGRGGPSPSRAKGGVVRKAAPKVAKVAEF